MESQAKPRERSFYAEESARLNRQSLRPEMSLTRLD